MVKLYEKNPNRKEIDKIVGLLKEGGVVVYPTDTVYAIGCDALNVRAVERICKIKGINPEKTKLSIICDDLSAVSEYAKVNNTAFKLLKKNLPGPFTFILQATLNLPKIYKNRKEVGIRIPDHAIARTLVRELGNPMLTTSVRSQEEDDEIYGSNPELIEEAYGSQIDLVIDGGYGGTEPSTVVDCTGEEIVITRQGKGLLVE